MDRSQKKLNQKKNRKNNQSRRRRRKMSGLRRANGNQVVQKRQVFKLRQIPGMRRGQKSGRFHNGSAQRNRRKMP